MLSCIWFNVVSWVYKQLNLNMSFDYSNMRNKYTLLSQSLLYYDNISNFMLPVVWSLSQLLEIRGRVYFCSGNYGVFQRAAQFLCCVPSLWLIRCLEYFSFFFTLCSSVNMLLTLFFDDWCNTFATIAIPILISLFGNSNEIKIKNGIKK